MTLAKPAQLSGRGCFSTPRLEQLRDLLPSGKVAGRVKVVFFSRSGFTRELRQGAASRDDDVLVDLGRLYRGD